MTSYIINSPHVISEIASGETVIINLETGSYYNLNEHASTLWALITEGVEVQALKKSICSNAEEEAQLTHFFTHLAEQALIKETDSPKSTIADEIKVNTNELVVETFTDMQELLGLDPIHEVEEEAGWPLQKA